MNVLLDLIKKLHPGAERSIFYRILEYIILAALLYGLYTTIKGDVEAFKHANLETAKGHDVQVGVNHTEIYILKGEITRLEERIFRLEDKVLKGQ